MGIQIKELRKNKFRLHFARNPKAKFYSIIGCHEHRKITNKIQKNNVLRKLEDNFVGKR